MAGGVRGWEWSRKEGSRVEGKGLKESAQHDSLLLI